MTNLGFHHAMKRHGINVVTTQVGDRYVLDRMLAGGFPIGGEQSGHIILSEHATTGDGVLTAVQLLAVMQRSGQPLAELAAVMTRLPQVMVNVSGVDRARLPDARPVWDAVRGGGGRAGRRRSGPGAAVGDRATRAGDGRGRHRGARPGRGRPPRRGRARAADVSSAAEDDDPAVELAPPPPTDDDEELDRLDHGEGDDLDVGEGPDLLELLAKLDPPPPLPLEGLFRTGLVPLLQRWAHADGGRSSPTVASRRCWACSARAGRSR